MPSPLSWTAHVHLLPSHQCLQTKATSLIFRVLKQVDSSTEDFVLKPGIYEWEFKFKLPMEGLPPSFRSNSEGWKGGHICYSVDGTIKQRDSDGTKKSVTRTYFNLSTRSVVCRLRLLSLGLALFPAGSHVSFLPLPTIPSCSPQDSQTDKECSIVVFQVLWWHEGLS